MQALLLSERRPTMPARPAPALAGSLACSGRDCRAAARQGRLLSARLALLQLPQGLGAVMTVPQKDRAASQGSNVFLLQANSKCNLHIAGENSETVS